MLFKLTSLTVLFTACLSAGMWSVIESDSFETQKADAKYKLDTSGFSPRIYEFTTKTAPIMKCVVLFSASKKIHHQSMVCLPKDTK